MDDVITIFCGGGGSKKEIIPMFPSSGAATTKYCFRSTFFCITFLGLVQYASLFDQYFPYWAQNYPVNVKYCTTVFYIDLHGQFSHPIMNFTLN